MTFSNMAFGVYIILIPFTLHRLGVTVLGIIIIRVIYNQHSALSLRSMACEG